MRSIDWVRLLARAKKLDKRLTAEQLSLWKRGLIDGNAHMWNVDYVDAAQAAVEKHDPRKLYAMMRAEIPPPPFLLPIIAGLSDPSGGRPAAFTAHEDALIGKHLDLLVKFLGRTEPVAATKIAAQRKVAVKTITRSLQRTGRLD